MKSSILCLIAVVIITQSVLAVQFDESEYLALELSGEILPPVELVAKIAADLDAVRENDSFMRRIEVRP
ncbi:MAG: hypothetical protein ABIF77_02800, partial [bacterium]